MSDKKSFYITTTLPYVNAEPHIGFAMEIVRADVIARWKKLQGYDVFFNTGTDEHGQKILEKAVEAGLDAQSYTDKQVKQFEKLLKLLNINDEAHFIRTTDKHHIKSAQEFWRLCNEKGDIYKKNYRIKYCVGCELEKTESELENGKCTLHPNQELEVREEENYFFRWSNYQKKLLNFYSKHPAFVIPNFRFNEIKAFVERGIEDFSISRLRSKMEWGIPVPGDDSQVMYVWFDALTNYISTLGWPEDKENFEKFWIKGTPTQYAGKDNLRQQSAMWQAMLMSADLPPSDRIVINGFITGEGGVKMSKSLGNVISPYDLVEKYGADATRYLLLRHIHPTEDTEITWAKLDEWYTANLANGLGNLVSRIMRMSADNLSGSIGGLETGVGINIAEHLENFEFQKAADLIWAEISKLDLYIQEEKPFQLVKTDPETAQEQIRFLVTKLAGIASSLAPLMPDISAKILELIEKNLMPDKPIFPRLNA